MNYLTILFLLCLIAISMVSPQVQPARQLRRPARPMTRSFGRVGRKGPIPPASTNSSIRRTAQDASIRPPGFKPPIGIAKKLNEAVDFRALARVLLRQ